jgi:hypothetical protein
MKFFGSVQTEKFRIEICWINLIILFYLFRTAIPFLKFPFLILYIGFIGYYILNYRKETISTLKEYARNYYLLLGLALILVLAFLLSDKIYLTIFKDVINMIILLSILFMLTSLVSGKEETDFFSVNFVYLIVSFAFIISVVSLLFFFDVLTYKDFIFDNSITETIAKESLTDYNFAILPVFFGFISILFLLTKTKARLQKVLYILTLILFSLQIFFSGSKRGMIIFILVTLLLLISQLFNNKSNLFTLKLATKESGLFLSVLFLIICSTYFFITRTPYYYKNKLLEFIGSKNILITKDKITKQVLRYSSYTDQSSSYIKLYNTLWTPTFIPEDPDSGWGNRIHKTIFPLTGKNAGIVPKTAKGYLMDSTCNASYYPEIDLCESYSLLANLKVKKGDRYRASIYCLVSERFDGNAVSLGVGSTSINKNIVYGKVTTGYDLNNKGVWQKLEVEFDCNDGDISILIDFWKNGVRNFSHMKGYVIFAYPQYEKIDDAHVDLPLHTTYNNINFTRKTKNVSSQDTIVKNRPALLSFIPATRKSVSFQLNFFPLISSETIRDTADPIRALTSKFISEDTTYHKYKSNLLVDPKWNKYRDERVVRWLFAIQIYSKEFNWKQKLFGGGFNFLNWYGYYFLKDRTASDWPHNPFLSILLYSGIIGLIIYCFFIYKVFYYYLKYKKEYPILFIFFLITFFFTFFSGGSPFDPPIMGFFVILPFFIHSIHEKEKNSTKSELRE